MLYYSNVWCKLEDSCIQNFHVGRYHLIFGLIECIYDIIIPDVNSPYKTSIDEQLTFNNITCCYSKGKCCNPFAIAAGDIIKNIRAVT